MATLEQLNLRKLWVEALRSGKYEQGINHLKQRDEDGKVKYCCLGVLCELCHIEWDTTDLIFWIKTDDDGSNSILPNKIRKQIGLNHPAGFYGYCTGLAQLNDSGTSFEELADIIESSPKGLFIDD